MRIRDGSSDVCSSDLRVEQLLALAQVEAAAVSLDQAVDLAAVARETITRLVPLALDSDHLLGLETAAPLPARGHPGAVAMILQNLIDNAIRHTPADRKSTRLNSSH